MNRNAEAKRLLVVDDDPVALRIGRAHLTNAGYEVVLAVSAAAARERLGELGAEAFAAVLSDYRMPDEDGLSLLNHVLALDPALGVILVTAEGEKELVMRSLRQGVRNYIEKPYDRATLLEAVRAAVSATAQNRRIRAEASSARAMASTQHLMLGRMTAAIGDRLSLVFHPCQTAGGDFAAVFSLDPHRFALLVSDVSGHDLRAAFHSAYFQGLARGLLARGATLPEVFQHLNHVLLDEWNAAGPIELSLAACGACVDTQDGSVQILNCGLPNPTYNTADGEVTLDGSSCSGPLGWFDTIPALVTLPLAGGQLQFWSDGLSDAAEQRGVSPLALAYRLHNDPGAAAMLLAEAKDDLIAARLDLGAVPGGNRCQPLFVQTYCAGAESRIDGIQADLEASLQFALPHVDRSGLAQALVCLREGILNALQHGCGADPAGSASVQVACTEGADALLIRIADTGPGHDFDYEAHELAAARDLLTEHRGLILMKNLSRRLALSGGGSRVAMEISLTQP